MKAKEVFSGNRRVKVIACEHRKKRWLELPKCKLETDSDVVSLENVLARCLDFLDGVGQIEDLPDTV